VALAPDNPELLLRYGRVLYLQDEQGESELTRAREQLLALDKRESAAEATLLLADIAWKQGRGRDVESLLQDARSLVTDLPASRAQAAVLTEVARYEALAGRVESALELGLQALAMAEELRLDDLRLRALNTVAIAHGDMGDTAGLAELEEVIELATRLTAVTEIVRGWNNLTALKILHGSLAEVREGEAETLRLARHYGLHGYVRFLEGGSSVGNRFLAGDWVGALERADKFIADVEQGARLYGAGSLYANRGLIRVACDDGQGAESDAEAAVEHARPLGDSQALNPRLAMAALVFVSVGDKQRAEETVTEALESLRSLRHIGFGVMHSPLLAWAALQLGREGEVVEVLEPEPFKSHWLRAALAVASRDFSAAADILGEGGFRALEAFFRLQSGSEEDARRAADFYRGVAATRYLREAEAVLAASA
jgi:hypothetical protein